MFRPTRKDDHRLSVYDGDQITAEAAWRHYTQAQHRRSVGVMSVTRRECRDTGLRVIGDGTPFPEHAVIEFSGLSRNETKTAAVVLAAAARRRGWQYRVP